MWKIVGFYIEPSGFYLKPHLFRVDAKDEKEADWYGCWRWLDFTWLWFTIELMKKNK